MAARVTNPTISQIIEIAEVLKANADFVYNVNITDDECVRREAEDWAKHGFAPDEVAEWLRAGYDGISSIAKVLRNVGLTPRQAECAMVDHDHLIWNKEDSLYKLYEFIRRARKYRKCCLRRR